MTPLRLATYNVEWFNALFDRHDRLLLDAELSARHKTSRAEQANALGIVLAALDADGVMIIEAPDNGSHRSSVKAIEGFARQFNLRTSKAVTGYASETEQEITFLYDPDRLSAVHDPQGKPSLSQGATGAPRFDTARRSDLDGDGIEELIRFSKPPLELAVTLKDGQTLRLIGVHAKSKIPRGPVTPEAFTRISIANRRKQLAECLWLRARAKVHLAAGDRLIVMGDFNDGPGLDDYEKLFGHSGIEIVLGLNTPPAQRLTDPHAEMVLSSRIGLAPTTARFWLQPKRRYFEALLDFIMVSPNLAQNASWRIWHPFNDPAILAEPELANALLSASDHFPVSIDLAMV